MTIRRTARTKADAGAWLKQQRKSAGLTQEELAVLLGTSTGLVGNYEQGRTWFPDDKVTPLARVLKLSRVEVRRALGLHVDDDAVDDRPPSAPSVLDAILADPTLLPEAKRHLVNQYGLLQRLQAADPSALQKDAAEHATEFDGWVGDKTVTPSSTATDQAPKRLPSRSCAPE